MIVLKSLAVLVGKEVLEYLVVDQALKLIGHRAQGRSNTMTTTNISFNSILARVSAAEAQINTAISQATASAGYMVGSAAAKVVQVAKSATTSVSGVMPVSNNALDERTLEVLKIAAITQQEVAHLKEQMRALGFVIADAPIDIEEVNETANAYLSIMKKPKKAVAPVAVVTQTVIAPAPEAPLTITQEQANIAQFLGIPLNHLVVEQAITQPTVGSPDTVVYMPRNTTPVPVAPVQQASHPLNIVEGKPSNWHEQ